MFKFPCVKGHEGKAQRIARAKLGVYIAKFDLEGRDYEEMSKGRRWEYIKYRVTLFRPDGVAGEFDSMLSYQYAHYKQGIGNKGDPKTWDFVNCLYNDMSAWESVKPDDDDDIQALQNYVDEFGYDEDDRQWLTKVAKIVRSLRDDYPDMTDFFGEWFTSELYKLQTFFDEEYGWDYNIEDIIQLICYDPTEEEWDEIDAGKIDYDDISRRYVNVRPEEK